MPCGQKTNIKRKQYCNEFKFKKDLKKKAAERGPSQEALDAAIEASNILFGKAMKDALEKLDEQTFLDVFDGVPQEHVSRTDLEAGVPIVDFMAVNTQIFPSKNEARKMTQANGVSVNKEKVTLDKVMTSADLIDGKYILVQKGKKNYYLVVVE